MISPRIKKASDTSRLIKEEINKISEILKENKEDKENREDKNSNVEVKDGNRGEGGSSELKKAKTKVVGKRVVEGAVFWDVEEDDTEEIEKIRLKVDDIKADIKNNFYKYAFWGLLLIVVPFPVLLTFLIIVATIIFFKHHPNVLHIGKIKEFFEEEVKEIISGMRKKK